MPEWLRFWTHWNKYGFVFFFPPICLDFWIFCFIMPKVLSDHKTPAEKDFSRGFELVLAQSMCYLDNNCRSSSVSMINAVKFLKSSLSQLPNNITDHEVLNHLCGSSRENVPKPRWISQENHYKRILCAHHHFLILVVTSVFIFSIF